MKKRFIVLSSLITILLASFPMVVFADENIEDIENLASVDLPDYALDQYFYDNYTLLPYIISDGSQYINTGIKPSSNIEFHLVIRDIDLTNDPIIFGSYVNNNGYQLSARSHDNHAFFNFGMESLYANVIINDPSIIYYLNFKNNVFSINGVKSDAFSATNLNNNLDIYLFNRNPFNSGRSASMSLLSFFLYDSENEEYLRYYYPAQSKSGAVGLYDSISKTFFVSASESPFISPINNNDFDLDIGSFLTSALGWIGDIFEFVIETPIILFFFAVALAGSIYRWARRVVHF